MRVQKKSGIVVDAEIVREISGPDGHIVFPECVVTRWFRRGLWVKTLEGWYKVRLGDVIITGVKGEHYPCRSDIFAETYMPAPLHKEKK